MTAPLPPVTLVRQYDTHRLIPSRYLPGGDKQLITQLATTLTALQVALEWLDSGQYQLGHLATSLQDVIRRGRVQREHALRLTEEAGEAARSGALSGRSDLPPFDDIAAAFRERVRELGAGPFAEPPPGDPLDYVRLVDEEHEHRHRRRRQGMG